MIDSIHHYMPEIIFIGLALFAATSSSQYTNHTQQQG
jgi:hypothetical protein